jgi:hypothetical protein
MVESLTSPAHARLWFLQGVTLFWILHLVGLACFAYIVWRRLTPLLRAAQGLQDPALDLAASTPSRSES